MAAPSPRTISPAWTTPTARVRTAATRSTRSPAPISKQFYFDTLVFSVEQLDYLIKTFGADHVLLGTDYPFDMGEYDPVEHVYQANGITESDREKICGLNAFDLMKVDPAKYTFRVKV